MQFINVYGTGLNAMKFILQIRDVTVRAFIEGKRHDIKNFMCGALSTTVPVVHVDDAEHLLKSNYTIVAASESTYWEIKQKLEMQYGLIEYENFEPFQTFRKKVVMVYGNCHTLPIKQALRLSKEFDSIYGIYPMKPIQDIKIKGGLDSNAYGKCELFIHQCIRQNNRYGEEYYSGNLIKKLKNGCTVIGIPNLYRLAWFLYPQIRKSDIDTTGVCWEGYNYFPFKDRYIDDNYKRLSIEQIRDLIQDENLINGSKILAERDAFFEKVEYREKEWDISVLEYLKKRIYDKQLFFEPIHPTGEVMSYVVEKLFGLLHLNYDIDQRQLLCMDTYEIPIYGAVKKALGLKYDVKYLRKYNGIKLNDRQMNIEEYIKQYITWNFREVKFHERGDQGTLCSK